MKVKTALFFSARGGADPFGSLDPDNARDDAVITVSQ